MVDQIEKIRIKSKYHTSELGRQAGKAPPSKSHCNLFHTFGKMVRKKTFTLSLNIHIGATHTFITLAFIVAIVHQHTVHSHVREIQQCSFVFIRSHIQSYSSSRITANKLAYFWTY